MGSLEANSMEIAIWVYLTYIAEVEVDNLYNIPTEYRAFLINRLKEAEEYVNLLLSNGDRYTCSYIFLFRSVLLDQHMLSDV